MELPAAPTGRQCDVYARLAPLGAHMPEPGTDPSPQEPGRESPNPAVPPDMEPVVPQQDPPLPGRPGDGEPPPIVAASARA